MTTTISPSRAFRRAILYIAWGEEHLQLAMASARSAAFMNVPAFFYTNEATAALVPDASPFERVITVEIVELNHLAKFYIMENLPAGFDSFLYLDVDTVVLKDVTFGFEMAERHGIAMAPAPHYSLDHFHRFGRVMTHAGVPLRGQYLYNAGVIFFSRRPDVMEVLKTWNDLAVRLVEETDYKKTDQPFLTLAMELLAFNPYTLAPTYNYRALVGEPISGDVFLWHSYHPVPEDLNAYDRPWPPRGYRGTMRVMPEKRTKKARSDGAT